MTASPDRIRDLLDRHWEASSAGDQDAEHDIYADDVIVEYPQSGEIIRGKHNIQAIRTHHPARRTFTVSKITGAGDTWVTEYLLTYDGTPTYTVSIMQFSGDHVTRETQYFADPFDRPAWRSRWTELRQPAARQQR
jgi:ketosteroid isomerase-like protein